METKAKVRRDYHVRGKSIKQIVRDRKLSRNTVRRILRSDEAGAEYRRSHQPRPQLGAHEAQLIGKRQTNRGMPIANFL